MLAISLYPPVMWQHVVCVFALYPLKDGRYTLIAFFDQAFISNKYN
jgi:hypothetical protein